ncbi:GerAB/ArcD/ProY family transporter [Siminovitchia acidinfaciens]|nr:GerAB/ArcD/ProY family transporter [Siminovitchia acidinfaciens]
MISKKQITQFQLIFLLIHAQVGVGVISMPFDVFLIADGDSWISVFLTGIILQGMVFLIWALMARFPSTNLYGIIQALFGKILGKAIIILYCIYFISIGSLVLAKFGYIIKVWMLPLTPTWLTLLLMTFTAYYIVKDNLQLMVRFFVLSSVVIVVFIGLSAYALKDANITYILPVGEKGLVPILKGIKPSIYSFQGFELLLLVYPFVQGEKNGVLKAATIANVFVTLFYSFLVLTSLLFFSPKELKLVPEPVFYLIKSFSFKMVERPDLLFTSMWIVLVATTFVNLVYGISLGFSHVMNVKEIKYFSLIAASTCFLVAINFQGKYEIASFSKVNNYFVYPFGFGLPFLLLVISILFKKKGQVENA